MVSTIFALGGGGFSMSDDGRSALDDHILGHIFSATGRDRPRVCFVPTASGDASGYIDQFEDAFADSAETSVLSLFGQSPWGYRSPSVLLEQDLIYVGGGSTANLLAIWRQHGLPEVLGRAAAGGTVLAGISAGANCWFEGSSTDSYGPLAPLRDGLGVLSGSICPHYRGESGRRESYQRWVLEGALPAGYAVDDGCALRFDDGRLTDVVTERAGHQAFRVEPGPDGVALEEPLTARLL
ncbi:Type 1 glutamine amidotransferase-like domain-containing protein [Nesterenkonia sp. K-15-9-6]|uniref:Type 1 glutamine amidotransferase-like domain-containing protein n=1 Tax=Nesterenkonia sp. K-15-9-6 TaxID=3093918 RepID=UPI0040447447